MLFIYFFNFLCKTLGGTRYPSRARIARNGTRKPLLSEPAVRCAKLICSTRRWPAVMCCVSQLLFRNVRWDFFCGCNKRESVQSWRKIDPCFPSSAIKLAILHHLSLPNPTAALLHPVTFRPGVNRPWHRQQECDRRCSCLRLALGQAPTFWTLYCNRHK